METNHEDCQFINIIPLMSSEEKLECRKVRTILRYYVPNVNKHAEQYAHHLLFSLYPFRNEEYLKSPPYIGTYLAKLQEPGVLDTINRNRQIMEPFSSLVNEALLNLSEGVSTSNDGFSQQENDEVEEELQNTANDPLDDDSDICHSQDNSDVPVS